MYIPLSPALLAYAHLKSSYLCRFISATKKRPEFFATTTTRPGNQEDVIAKDKDMMASGSSGPLSANQRSRSDATGEQLTHQQIQILRSEEWTEEREAELTELKAKLKAAHKSWSAEQELYHDRVGGQALPQYP